MYSHDQMVKDFVSMSKGETNPKAFYRIPKVSMGKEAKITIVEPTQMQVSQAKEQVKDDIKRKRAKKKSFDTNPFQ